MHVVQQMAKRKHRGLTPTRHQSSVSVGMAHWPSHHPQAGSQQGPQVQAACEIILLQPSPDRYSCISRPVPPHDSPRKGSFLRHPTEYAESPLAQECS